MDPDSEGIYFDYHASTPVDPKVVERMMPWWRPSGAGNPHSNEHARGWRAAEAVNTARREVADLIGADTQDVLFTSGATESNNLALFGAMRGRAASRGTLITIATEHASVLGPASALRKEGFRSIVIPVDSQGFVRQDALLDALSDDVSLVSIGAANNEIGTLQDLLWISSQCHRVGALLHTDAAQALTAKPLSLVDTGVDMASLSAHKAYGPQGVGALFIAPGIAREIEPICFGGGQQLGLRPGTMPTALCVGFGEACRILSTTGETERLRTRRLRDELTSHLLAEFPEARINGPRDDRHPGNINIRLPCDDARDVIQILQPRFALSSGSACHSGGDQASHVLEAIGLNGLEARSCLRLGVGRFSTLSEVEAVVEAIVRAVTSLCELGRPDLLRAS